MKRLLTKLALWILGGQYVPVAELRAAELKSIERLLRAIRADIYIKSLQQQNSESLTRALVAEAALSSHVCPQTDYTETVQTGSPQMIDIRVPRKVLK